MLNRVALDCNIFGLQRFGGISNYWAQLVAALGEAQPRSCDLILPRDTKFVDAPVLAQVSAHREALPNRLARYLPAPVPKDATLLHSSYYRVPNRAISRYFVTVYDFTYERYRSGLPKWVHHTQKGRGIKAADLVICISQSTRADLLEAFPTVDPVKAVVVPLGVDHAKFFRESANEPDLPPYVLFVGQRKGYKRFDIAVDALRSTRDLSLGVVGPALDAEEKAYLQSALGNRWIEFGPVRDDRLRRLYNNAHAFLFTSDYEGFGLPILEAMACGCPVVAANRSSFPEVAGDAALLSKDQSPDAYAELVAQLDNSDLRTRLIQSGNNRAAGFTWAKTVADTIRFYA